MDPVLYQRGSEDTIVNPNLTYDTGFTYGQGRAQCILSCWLGAQGVASGYKVALKKIPIHTISQDDIQNIPQLEQHKHLTNQNGHSKNLDTIYERRYQGTVHTFGMSALHQLMNTLRMKTPSFLWLKGCQKAYYFLGFFYISWVPLKSVLSCVREGSQADHTW